MPISAMAVIAAGWTRVASVPPLTAANRSACKALTNPSAIWDRAELWTQMNRTVMGIE